MGGDDDAYDYGSPKRSDYRGSPPATPESSARFAAGAEAIRKSLEARRNADLKRAFNIARSNEITGKKEA